MGSGDEIAVAYGHELLLEIFIQELVEKSDFNYLLDVNNL